MVHVLAEQFLYNEDDTYQTQIDEIRAHNQLGYIYSYPDKRLYQPVEDSASFIKHSWEDYEGPVGLYVHVPWCTPKPPSKEDIELMKSQHVHSEGRDHLCSYCNLYTAVRNGGIPDWYGEAVSQEVALYEEVLTDNLQPQSLYFGGGSPSLLSVSDMDRIITSIETVTGEVPFDTERAIEVIPDSVDFQKLKDMHRFFNRISVGVQSFDPYILRSTGRDYPAHLGKEVIQNALDIGYDDVNGDLIIGLQNSTQESFINDVSTMIDSGATTVTLYQNMIRSGTRAGKMARHNILSYPSQSEIYDWTNEADAMLQDEGYTRLSLTCWTKNGKGYQQGEQIYQQIPILGLGAGARSYGPNGHYAIPYTENVKLINNAIARWKNNIQNGIFADIHGIEITSDLKLKADVILGLMSQQGVPDELFHKHFRNQLHALLENKLVYKKDGAIFYTDEGKAYSGALSSLFYSEIDKVVTIEKNTIRTH